MGELQLQIAEIRKQFPLLTRQVYGKPLVYFDNAATNQKPLSVIDAITKYYTEINSNIHRGVHYLSQAGTEAYEETRKKVQQFINAKDAHEIIFTRGTTESINLVASSFGKKFLNAGDSVLISAMEHHSNILPWQLICEEKGAKLEILEIDSNGNLQMDLLENKLQDKPKIFAVTHVSNTLGTVNDIKKIIETAHIYDVPVLIDGAQSISHIPVDVSNLDCDFFCFSSHKMYGPFGVGVVYGKEKWLEQMPPYQSGGEMIKNVSFEKSTFNDLPFKFEAGTPNVADVVAFHTAIDFIEKTGYNVIAAQEEKLLKYATEKLQNFESLEIYGKAGNKSAVISFNLKGIHHYDAGVILDKMGIAVRTGHHCTQPLMDFFKIPGTIRASFAVYNTIEEIDYFIEALAKTQQMLS